ncbi:GDP-mannose transporter GONST2 isoform X3 [Ziziphus jujuba]|uniref:GDP-mannose transporter GONST2 isoform X3 n=1 Tax=Ziziphus jujuba TaxID=326968 RepID=A0A6P6FWA3_ZIZJJ|nr:GDP-mannose transporter GONST2 isoform X3 [Ziziphus jujuba]
MSSGFNSGAVQGLDNEDLPISSVNDAGTTGERANGGYAVHNGIGIQGNASIINVPANAERRALVDRFSRGRPVPGDSVSILVYGDEKREHGSGTKSSPLLSGTAYCFSSCSMILLNKVVLSSYNFNAGISLMFYQNFISSVIVILLGLCGAVSVEKLNWKLIRVWIPVNVIFVGMLVSGMYSTWRIVYVSETSESESMDRHVFDGYSWQIINCVLTATYSLTLRRVMDEAKKQTKSGSLNEFSMVLLNNLLSLPFAIFLILLFGEWEYVVNVDVAKLPMFWVVATASGLLGLAISFTSMWFLHQTGPTTYSLVGSLNKIPISIAGTVLFKVPISLSNLFSILFGLFAGVFFAGAKMS